MPQYSNKVNIRLQYRKSFQRTTSFAVESFCNDPQLCKIALFSRTSRFAIGLYLNGPPVLLLSYISPDLQICR